MDLLRTRQVDPVHQSPPTRMYGFFTHGTVPPSRLYSSGFLSLPDHLRRLPSPTQFRRRSPGHVTFITLQVICSRPTTDRASLALSPPWADRFILGITPSIAARYFSAGPSDSTSRWTPCPPEYRKRWLQVGLGCVQLSPSCPFRRLHTFRFLRPARLRTPLLGYGAPHLSARGTSALLNNALLSAHFLFADDSPGE